MAPTLGELPRGNLSPAPLSDPEERGPREGRGWPLGVAGAVSEGTCGACLGGSRILILKVHPGTGQGSSELCPRAASASGRRTRHEPRHGRGYDDRDDRRTWGGTSGPRRHSPPHLSAPGWSGAPTAQARAPGAGRGGAGGGTSRDTRKSPPNGPGPRLLSWKGAGPEAPRRTAP